MAEKYELDRWAAVVCNGFTAVNVMSSGNVEELGWDYTEMELDPTGTCGLFDGMLLDWDDDTPAERRDHEAYFPDAFTVGARILADDWDHELGNDEVRSRCFAIIEDADRFTDHDTARDWLCESTMADFSEVEARTFFQNLTLMDSEEIAKLDGRPIIPSAGADECRAAVLAFTKGLNRMYPRPGQMAVWTMARTCVQADRFPRATRGATAWSHRSLGSWSRSLTWTPRQPPAPIPCLPSCSSPWRTIPPMPQSNSSGSIRGLTQADARLSPRFSTP